MPGRGIRPGITARSLAGLLFLAVLAGSCTTAAAQSVGAPALVYVDATVLDRAALRATLEEAGGRVAVVTDRYWLLRLPEHRADHIEDVTGVREVARPEEADLHPTARHVLTPPPNRPSGQHDPRPEADHAYPCVLLPKSLAAPGKRSAHPSDEHLPGTSDLMMGSSAVALFFPNNTGSDPQYPVAVEWTDELVDEIVNNVVVNLAWWTDRAAEYGIEKTFELVVYGPDHPAMQLDYDPVTAGPFSMMNDDLISQLGYSEDAYPPDDDDGNLEERQRLFLDDLRDSLDTDWAFIGNIVAGAESFQSHAAFFGPHTNVWYAGAQSGLLFAHEIGHIYGLRDEYRERAPQTFDFVKNGVANGNADFRNPHTVPCMMKNNWGLCTYTVAQLEWRDAVTKTTIEPDPPEAAFAATYRNPETGLITGVDQRRFTGSTSLPLALHSEAVFHGLAEVTVDGTVYGHPTWDETGASTLDWIVDYESNVTLGLHYAALQEPADVTTDYLYHRSPVAGVRTRDVLHRDDGSVVVAGLDGVVVLEEHATHVLDAPHGRVEEQYREAHAVAEAPDGTIWFTTHFGEVVGWNDGTYDIRDDPQVAGQALGPIAVTPDGDVWSAVHESERTGGAGLLRFGDDLTVYDTRNSPILSDAVTDVAVDDAGHVWVAFNGGRAGSAPSGLQRFDPAANAWTDLTEALPDARVQSVNNSGHGMTVSYEGGVSRYVEGTWAHHALDVPWAIRDVDVDADGHLLAGTVGGLFLWTTDGDTLHFDTGNTTLPEDHVAAVDVIGPGELYLAFWNDGAVKMTYDGDAATSIASTNLPITVRLYPNYPNPFNPVTHLRFDLPAPDRVRIDVFDVLGRRVRQLTDAAYTAGTHTVSFDASGLASGVYLYRLSTGSRTVTRRMLLLK